MEPDEVGLCRTRIRREVLQYYVTDLDESGRRPRVGREKYPYVGWITQAPV